MSLNPVRAGLVTDARAWPWSSVAAHLVGQDDGLVMVAPVLERVEDFARLLDTSDPAEVAFRKAMQTIRSAEVIGRPLGTADFIADLERRLGRPLARRAPGRKPRPPSAEQPLLL